MSVGSGSSLFGGWGKEAHRPPMLMYEPIVRTLLGYRQRARCVCSVAVNKKAKQVQRAVNGFLLYV